MGVDKRNEFLKKETHLKDGFIITKSRWVAVQQKKHGANHQIHSRQYICQRSEGQPEFLVGNPLTGFPSSYEKPTDI